MAQYKGIDVSRYQGNIDWAKVKADGVKFVILRAGYGRYAHQVDSKFEEYYKGAKAVGLPVGCYWFSYATTPAVAEVEANTCVEVLKGKTFELPVFYDIEGSALSTGSAAEKCKAFCDVINKKGFIAGVYCSKSPFETVLKNFKTSYTCVRWIAFYSSNYPSSCEPVNVWQYSSKGKVAGISGNVDMDTDYWMLDNLIKKPTPTPKKSIDEIAKEVIAGKWGNSSTNPTRKQRLEAAGYDYNKVQDKVNAILKEQSKPTPKKSITEIAQEVLDGKWGNGAVRKSKLKAAGYDYDKVQAEVNRLQKLQKEQNSAKYVTVKKGDTMSSIAKANKTTLATLKKLNPTIKDINKIYVGQKIRVK